MPILTEFHCAKSIDVVYVRFVDLIPIKMRQMISQ